MDRFDDRVVLIFHITKALAFRDRALHWVFFDPALTLLRSALKDAISVDLSFLFLD